MPQATKQLFFDCDNTIVFSEEPAFEACADLTNEILAEQGINDRYTPERLIVDFVGLTFKGIMASLQEKYGFKMTPEKINYYAKQEEDVVISKLQNKARATEGSMDVLSKLHEDKKYKLAVVSSSAIRRIRASIAKVGQDKFFPYEHVYSAASSLDKPTAKPNPAIYNHAMKMLGVKPEECVTVEDSKSGALAAIRAKIPCIAYVGAYSTKEKQIQVGKTLTELGCRAVMYHWDQYFDCLEKIEQY